MNSFFCEKLFFGVGTLPQALFFMKQIVFWCWNVAAGAFFDEKNAFGAESAKLMQLRASRGAKREQ